MCGWMVLDGVVCLLVCRWPRARRTAARAAGSAGHPVTASLGDVIIKRNMSQRIMRFKLEMPSEVTLAPFSGLPGDLLA